MLDQRPYQFSAAEHVQRSVTAVLQRGHRLCQVALEEGRVLPGNRLESPCRSRNVIVVALTLTFPTLKLVRGVTMDNRSEWTWSGDPLRLPRVRSEELPTVTGDRRPGAKFCSGCGSSLDGSSLVTRGFWAYCSIDCAIRTERDEQRS